MAEPELTETTVRYLFATSWLPCTPGQQLVRVPGGSTTGLDTGANLLHYLDAEPELTNAVISDCLNVVLRSFNPSLGG